MEEKSAPGEPAPDQDSSIVARRERRLRQLKCPRCGLGRLPNTRFCFRCGAELPQLLHEESPEQIEEKRPRNRALNWLVDLAPGLIVPRVLAAVAVATAIAALGGVMANAVFSKVSAMGPFAAVFIVPLGALLGGGGLILYVSALTWLLCGSICNPVVAMTDFKTKHWLLLMTLTVGPPGLLLSIL